MPTDLLDMYNSGAFSKEPDNEKVDEVRDNEVKEKQKPQLSQVLVDIDVGKEFFNQYLHLTLNKIRSESTSFGLEDLYSTDDESANKRKETEKRFLEERKGDFVKYVEALNSFIGYLGE